MSYQTVMQKLNELESSVKIQPTDLKLCGFNGNEISVLGMCPMLCVFNGISREIKLFVVETETLTVLGLQSCRGPGIIKLNCAIQSQETIKKEQEEKAFSERVRRISNKSGDELRQEILEMYPDVFSGLGRLEPAYHIELDPNSKPVIHPPRKIPASLREKLKK